MSALRYGATVSSRPVWSRVAAPRAIVFSGGIDIDPTAYGAERHPTTDPAQEHRDAGELALLERALGRDMPTLAICRGFQLLNVLRGGDLVQHLFFF